MSGPKGILDESRSDEPESRPTINLFEQWEEGAHMPLLVNAGLFESALLACNGYEWNRKPIHRHISCFANAILYLYHSQNHSRSF